MSPFGINIKAGLLVFIGFLAGCGASETEDQASLVSERETAPADPVAGDVDLTRQTSQPANNRPPGMNAWSDMENPAGDTPVARQSRSENLARPPLFVIDESPQGRGPTGQQSATGGQPTLRGDLTADQLVRFLAAADKDMQVLASGAGGIEDPAERRRTLFQIVKLKREASSRLASDPAASQAMRREGRRGELQAMSHLASLGDLQAAEALERLARNNLSSDDPSLVSDSQLVLIGFALEDLQNGVQTAPGQIVDLVRDLSSSASNLELPAMMVMGQARQMLNSYGYEDQARQIRDAIVDLFADSPDQKIAEMAAVLAGNVRFDEIDALLDRALQPVTRGDLSPVTSQQWTRAVERLIDESADLQTVQYLCGAAVELESRSNLALAQATYDVMLRRFTDTSSANFREMSIAVRAYQKRRDAIGDTFGLTLPSVSGASLSMADYQGKIVLMPFWSIDFPQSLQILPLLRQYAANAPSDVAIVGVNLDEGADRVRMFTEKSGIDFPSFLAAAGQSESDPAVVNGDSPEPKPNSAASKFGVVSLPCVVVFDRQGQVVKIDFAGRQLGAVLDRLLRL